MEDGNVARFLLIFFLGFIGSIIINHSSLKPAGFTSRSWMYFFIGPLTFGIYTIVGMICNLTFDSNKQSNIGYVRD